MKIRLMGNQEELEEAVQNLKQIFQVKYTSRLYPNRENADFRVYLEVEKENDMDLSSRGHLPANAADMRCEIEKLEK